MNEQQNTPVHESIYEEGALKIHKLTPIFEQPQQLSPTGLTPTINNKLNSAFPARSTCQRRSAGILQTAQSMMISNMIGKPNDRRLAYVTGFRQLCSRQKCSFLIGGQNILCYLPLAIAESVHLGADPFQYHGCLLFYSVPVRPHIFRGITDPFCHIPGIFT